MFGLARLPWLLAAGAVISAAAFGLGWKFGTDRIKASLVTQMRTALEAQREQFSAELAARDKLLSDREKEAAARRRQVQYWQQRFAEAVKNDESCAIWASTKLPACAIERLRRDLPGSRPSEAPPPSPSDRTD